MGMPRITYQEDFKSGQAQLVLKWLKGDPVTINDQVYIFPHGQKYMRKIMKDII